ncbi:hypothetical protein ACOMHN_053360 [Nucella lapillus]
MCIPLPTDQCNRSNVHTSLLQAGCHSFRNDLSQGLSQQRLTDGSGTQDSDPSQEEDSRPSLGSHSGEAEEGEEEVNDGDDDASDEDGDDNDILDSAGEDEHDDQVTLLSKRKYMPTVEDNDFMTAFDKMMTDNIQNRTQESLKVPQLDIAVPMHLRGKNKKAVLCPTSLGGPLPVPVKEENSVSFVLMTRRGNKQQLTNLDVPITEGFATKFREREEAERMEKERMKQMVLNIHERQEEEDYQEMLASLSRSPPSNLNRERRVRYQHPKGAPDADLIFGSGPK